MFLRGNKRFKDGKGHSYWSVVENRRVTGGRSVQKTLLYLGEISDSARPPDFRLQHPTLLLRFEHIELARPRRWGGCWIALKLWHRLDLDGFWQPLLPESQKGTPRFKGPKTFIAHRM